MARKIRYAVVGLGHIAQNAVLPAFEHARNSQLVALVSGEPRKLKAVGKQYGVERLCSYDEYDELLASGSIDAVYIALPNDMHLDYTLRAAYAGVHVLCEKPLGMSAVECARMIEACRINRVRLMTAYRLHFDEANLHAIEIARSGRIGDPRYMISSFSFPVKEDNIRTDPKHTGGPVYDIGIYCINAARYLFAQEPIEVFAAVGSRGKSRALDRVGETYSVILRFTEGRFANFVCSFGAASTAFYQLVGTKGDVRLDGAYEYQGEMSEFITVDEKLSRKRIPKHDQFAPELIYFSDCVLKNREPEPSGEEGLADLRVIDAIFESIREGRPVHLFPFKKDRRPGKEQKFRIPPAKPKKQVGVQEPSKKAA